VNGHLNTGGIEKTLIDLLSYIDYTKYKVDLFLLEGSGDYAKFLPSKVNLIVFNANKVGGPFFQVLWRLIKEMEWRLLIYRIAILLSVKLGSKCLGILRPVFPIKRHYDYVVSYKTGICSEIVAYAVSGEKKLCWWHNGEFNMSHQQKQHTFNIWNHFDKIVSVSEGCKKLLISEFPALADKMDVLHNVLDINKISKFASESSSVFHTASIKIISIGNLTKRKHFDNAILAAKKLLEKGIDDFHWIIIGDGEEKENLQRMIDDYKLSSKVELAGKKVNPYPYINAADLMVHTSYGEAHCTAILEAMALKIPCLVTKTFIPQDFTVDKYNCSVVNQGIAPLLDGLLDMLQNRTQWGTLTNNAYKWVCEKYAPNVIVSDFYKLIN